MILRILLGLAALAGAGVAAWHGWIYAASEAYLRDVERPPAFAFPIPTDAAAVERGRHIARTRGCFGCHGQALEGKDFAEQWGAGYVAPNLAKHAQAHDAPALEAAIRHGIGADGRALWSMPSYNWAHLNDEDTADLIAFLKSAPEVEADLPKPYLPWSDRKAIVFEGAKHYADWAKDVPPPSLGPDAAPQLQRGEYLARTMCNECHGLDLRGGFDVDYATPDLALVANYPEDDFRRLLTTGMPPDGRDLGLMTLVAPDRFAYLTDQEFEDLYAYLKTLIDEPVPQGVWWRELR